MAITLHTFKMSKQDLVSIIMPSHNSASFIKDTIDSVLAQTYQNWELLISDDKSSDNTVKICQSYVSKDKRIKIFPSKRNFGPAVTRNRSIDKAKGRYIAFLDSDDLWHPEKLERQIAYMNKHDIGFCYTQFDYIYENGDFAGKAKALPHSIDYHGLLGNQVIGCLTVMIDTNICGKHKMPVIRKRQDFALWLRIMKKGHLAHCLSEVLGTYRIRKNSVSRNKWKALSYNWKLYRDVERLPLHTATSAFIRLIWNKLTRPNAY